MIVHPRLHTQGLKIPDRLEILYCKRNEHGNRISFWAIFADFSRISIALSKNHQLNLA
jgi:hypothetical protein